MATIALIDLSLGNLASVRRAVADAAGSGHDVAVTRLAADVARADVLVVPGQGAFRDGATALEQGGLGDAIRGRVRDGAPYLGICLGLQLLFDSSDEAPGARGLSLFSGHVKRLACRHEPSRTRPRLPHIGWNEVTPTAVASVLPRDPEHFYFVHSYAVAPEDDALVLATTEHGERFVSAVGRDRVLAVQFHPEKSQLAGARLMSAFFRSALGERS